MLKLAAGVAICVGVVSAAPLGRHTRAATKTKTVSTRTIGIELPAPATTYPSCKMFEGTVHAMCGGTSVKQWGIGPEGEASAIGNCNYVARLQKRYGACDDYEWIRQSGARREENTFYTCPASTEIGHHYEAGCDGPEGAAAGQWLDLSGRPTMQSSTGWSGSAARAVDGNSNPSYSANSCTHTQYDSSPWWQVELGENTRVESVRVTNRGDCCGDRLNGLQVTVDGQLCASGVTFNQGETKEITCTAPVTGTNVRLEIPGRHEYLTLCEVGVKAAGGDPTSMVSPNSDDCQIGYYVYCYRAQGWSEYDISPVVKMVREDGSSVVAEAAAYWGADTFADRQAACQRLAQTDEVKALQTKARQTQSTLSLGVSQSATVLFFEMQLGMSAVVGPDGEFACVANTGLGFDLELLGGSVGVFAEMAPNEMGGWGNLGGALDGSTWCFSLGVSGALGGVSFTWSMDKDVLHQDHLELQATLIAVFTQAVEDSSGDTDLTLELLRTRSLSLLRELGVLSFGIEAVIGFGVLESPLPVDISAGVCAEHIIWCTAGHCDQTDGGVYDKRADMLTALPDNTACDEMNGSCGYCKNKAGLGASGLTVCGGANNALLDAQEKVRDFAADTVVEVYETITDPIKDINDWAANQPKCWPSGISCEKRYGIDTCQACCNGHNTDWFWQTSECK